MTTKLQPPVGTVIETGEEAIRILLSPEYVEFFASADCKQFTNLRGHVVYFNEVVEGRYLPYTVIGVSEGFTEDPNFSMQERVQQVTIPAMPDVDGVPSEPPPEPLKYYVWVDGKPFPSKAHDARQEAVNEALRLSQKENKYAVVCTDIIKPVTRAEIVELEKG
jgi:hypothetical protein